MLRVQTQTEASLKIMMTGGVRNELNIYEYISDHRCERLHQFLKHLVKCWYDNFDVSLFW